MTMHDCPCCLPPSDFRVSQEKGFLYVGKQIQGGTFPSNLMKIGLDGTTINAAFWTGTAADVGMFAISSDPISGRVYTVNYDKVIGISKTGTVLWTSSAQLANSYILALACDRFGDVFSGGTNCTLIKHNGSTGAQIWSYFSPGPPYMQISGICIDQQGNCYVRGSRLNQAGTASLIDLFSLDSSGALRWGIILDGGAAPRKITYQVAINAANDTLVTTLDNKIITINPATGAVLTNTTMSGAASFVANAWNNFGDHYTTGDRIYQNASTLMFSTGSGVTHGVATDQYTRNVYFTRKRPTSAPTYTIQAIDDAGTTLWGIDTGSTAGLVVNPIEFSEGQSGAFGDVR